MKAGPLRPGRGLGTPAVESSTPQLPQMPTNPTPAHPHTKPFLQPSANMFRLALISIPGWLSAEPGQIHTL